MRTLASVARRPQETGTFLPPVFAPLEAMKIRLREGCATFIAGPPGAMKSGFTLYWVARLGVPTMYFSADMEPFETFERAAAMMTGDTMDQVRLDPDSYIDTVNSLSIRFCYNDSPTYDDVAGEVAAYMEVFGAPPRIIAIDNLLNLSGEVDDEWAAHREHAKVIHKLARVTKAAVIVLAHMADDRTDPSGKPAPRKSLQGKVSHLPKAIYSLAFNGEVLKVAPVKSKFGPEDPSGNTYAELWVDPARAQFFNSRMDFLEGRPA